MDRSERRKLRKKKIGILPLISILTLAVILTSVILFLTDSLGFASSLRGLLTAGAQELLDEDGLRLIEGDFTIDAPGVRFEDTHITGNLYLAQSIGNGSVELDNVIVDGSVLVQGGGMNTIYMVNCTFKEIRVNRPEGSVKLIAAGDSSVSKTTLETGARLIENITPGFEGFRSIQVMTDEHVDLIGSFESIHIMVKDANVELESDALAELLIAKTAGGSALKYPDGIIITKMYLDGTVYLIGSSDVDQAYLSASGISELEGNFNQARVAAEAGHFDLKEGSTFNELIVAKDALNNVLNLAENVIVAYMELNEAVEVKGQGEIVKVVISAPGSTIEQIPLEIEFTEEVSVIISGHEISNPAMLKALKEHGDPNYVVKAAAEPAPAPKPVPESAPEPAPDPEPEPEPEPDPEPDPVETFIVEDGLTPGKKMVIVVLNVSDPENYTVTVGETSLGYNAEAKSFWGEIDSDDALRSKVIVSR